MKSYLVETLARLDSEWFADVSRLSGKTFSQNDEWGRLYAAHLIGRAIYAAARIR